MHLAPVLAFALTLGSTVAQSCGQYPLLDTKLEECKTATAFCESLLGRSGTTTTVTVATYTSTVPKSTFTYLQVSTKTIVISTFVPTSYVTYPIVSCVTTPVSSASDLGFQRIAAAAAAGSSCGLGGYKPATISEVCSCAIDSTVYDASTTKKVKKGTTLKITSATASYTTTSTSYSFTATTTATVLHDNCYPPSNASCLYPATCGYYYETYYCGSDYEYDCYCGYDSHFDGYCFRSDSCYDLPTCTNDYDCAEGWFCLEDSCCDGPVCSQADICVGDTVTTSSSTADVAEPTANVAAARKAGTNSGQKAAPRLLKDRAFKGMGPFGPIFS